jgi:hypothetical protein
MGDEDLPVPAQLETQLGKCKTVRKASEYYKSREKTSEVRTCKQTKNVVYCVGDELRTLTAFIDAHSLFRIKFLQEMKASKSKLPPLPVVTK